MSKVYPSNLTKEEIMSKNCLVCQSEHLREVFKVNALPLVQTPINDLNVSEIFGDLDIVQCQHCSLIYNRAFNSAMLNKIYTENYSSGIPNTPKMLEKFQKIIDETILKKNIKNQCAMEIGASDFAFSELLLERGASKVIAFEPSNLFQPEDPRIHHVNGLFSPGKIPGNPEEIGLIVMRHVLEHIPEPINVIKQIASIAQRGLKLYIEVPNAKDIIENKRFYEFFYEHVTYFSPELLTKILKKYGFTTHTVNYLVNGQHFGILCEKTEAVTSEPLVIEPVEALPDVEGFKTYTERFLQKLHEVINSYDKIAIYGAGAHGIGVASFLEIDNKQVECFLDLNQMKAGKYSPKTHIPITIPDKEKLQKLDAIVIIAPLHQDAIAADLRGKFAFTKDIWGTYPDVFKVD